MRDTSERLCCAIQGSLPPRASGVRTKRSNGRVQNVKDVRSGADEIVPEEVDAEGCERYAGVDLGEVEYVTQPQIVVLPNEGIRQVSQLLCAG